MKQLSTGISYAYFITEKSHIDATLSSEITSAQESHAAQISASVIGTMVHVLSVANADCENNSSPVQTAGVF